MRILVSFDLPVETSKDRREYRRFRKFLLKEGFAMTHYSLYSKLTLNATQSNSIEKHVEENRPPKGSVFILTITERQFAQMRFIVGESQSGESVVQSDESLIIL